MTEYVEIVDGNTAKVISINSAGTRYADVPNDEDFINIHSNSSIDQGYLLEKMYDVENLLKKMDTKADVHATETHDEHDTMAQSLESLIAENKYFRKQLSNINTPTKLKKYSSLIFSLSISAILFDKLTSIQLIHPILLTFSCIISVVFFIMSVGMGRQDKAG